MSYPSSPRGSSASPIPAGILIPHGSPAASMIAAAQGTGLVVLPPPPLTFKNLTIHTSLMSTKQQLQQQQHQYHAQLNVALRRQQMDIFQHQQQQRHFHHQQHDTQSLGFDRSHATALADKTLGLGQERRRICSDTTMTVQSGGHGTTYFGDQESPILLSLPTTPNGEPFPPPEHWNYTMARFQASLIPLSQVEDPPEFFESLDGQSIIHHDDGGELPAPPPPLPASFSSTSNNNHSNHINTTTNSNNYNSHINNSTGINNHAIATTTSTTLTPVAVNDMVSTNSTCHATFALQTDSSRDHHDQPIGLKKHLPGHSELQHSVPHPRSMTPPAGLYSQLAARFKGGPRGGEGHKGDRSLDQGRQRSKTTMGRSPSRCASSCSASSTSSAAACRLRQLQQRMPSEGLDDVFFYDGDQLHVAKLRTGKATTATTMATVAAETAAAAKTATVAAARTTVDTETRADSLPDMRHQSEARPPHLRSVSHQWSSRAINAGRSPSSKTSSVDGLSERRSSSRTSHHSMSMAAEATTVAATTVANMQNVQQQQQQQSREDENHVSQKNPPVHSRGEGRGGGGSAWLQQQQQQHPYPSSPARRPDCLHRSLSAGSGTGSNEWHRRASMPKSIIDYNTTRPGTATAHLKRHTMATTTFDRHSPIQSHLPLSHSPQQQQQQQQQRASGPAGVTIVRNGGVESAGSGTGTLGDSSTPIQDPFLGFPYNNSSLLMSATEAEMTGQRRKSRLLNHDGEIRTKNSNMTIRNGKKEIETTLGNNLPGSLQSLHPHHNRHHQYHQHPAPEGERVRKSRIDSGHDAGDTSHTPAGTATAAPISTPSSTSHWNMDQDAYGTVTSSPPQVESPGTVSHSSHGFVEPSVDRTVDSKTYHSHTMHNSTGATLQSRLGFTKSSRPRPLSVAVNGLDFADVDLDLVPSPLTMQPPHLQQPQQPVVLPVDFGGFPQHNSSALMSLMDNQWGDQYTKRSKEKRKKKGSSDHQRRKSKDLSSTLGLSSSEPHRYHHRPSLPSVLPLDGAEHQRQRLYSQNRILSQDSLESAHMQSTCSAETSASAMTNGNNNGNNNNSANGSHAHHQGYLVAGSPQPSLSPHLLVGNYHSGSIRQQKLRMNKLQLVGGAAAIAMDKRDDSFSLEGSPAQRKGGEDDARAAGARSSSHGGYDDDVALRDSPLQQYQHSHLLQQHQHRLSFATGSSSVSSLEESGGGGGGGNNGEYKSLVRDGPESFDCALSDGALSGGGGGGGLNGGSPSQRSESPTLYRQSYMPTATTTATMKPKGAFAKGGGGEPLERIPSGMAVVGQYYEFDRHRSSSDTPIQTVSSATVAGLGQGQGHGDRLMGEETPQVVPSIRTRNLTSSNRVRPTSAPLGSLAVLDRSMQPETAATVAAAAAVATISSPTAPSKAGHGLFFSSSAMSNKISSSPSPPPHAGVMAASPTSTQFLMAHPASPPLPTSPTSPAHPPSKKTSHPFLGAMSLTLGTRRQFFAEQKKQRDLEAREAAAAVAAAAAQASGASAGGSVDFFLSGDDEGSTTGGAGNGGGRKYGGGGRALFGGGAGGQGTWRTINSPAESSAATTVGSVDQLEQQKKKRKEKFLEGLKRFLLRPTPNLAKRPVTIHGGGSGSGSGISGLGDMDGGSSGGGGTGGDGHDRDHRHHRFRSTLGRRGGREITLSATSPALQFQNGHDRSIHRATAANSSLVDDEEDHDAVDYHDDEEDENVEMGDKENDPMYAQHPFHSMETAAHLRHGRHSQDLSMLMRARDASASQQQHQQQRQRQRHSLMTMMMGSSPVSNGGGAGGDTSHDLCAIASSSLRRDSGNGEPMLDHSVHEQYQQAGPVQQQVQYYHHPLQNQRRMSARNILQSSSSPAALESSSTAAAVATISSRKLRTRSGPQNATIYTQWRKQATVIAPAAPAGPPVVVGTAVSREGDGQPVAADHEASLHL
ncbi:hypothetical protein BGZ73_005796 [Actinomortierella ambigua]|nr:hypothetical protein BGZ73_005796 [Actinomortierella ambigua]